MQSRETVYSHILCRGNASRGWMFVRLPDEEMFVNRIEKQINIIGVVMRIGLLKSIFLAGLIGSAGLSSSTTLAQDSPLAEDQKAVLVFDVRMDRIQDGEMGKLLDLESRMDDMTDDPDAPPASSVSRIFGAASAPDNMAQFEEMEDGGDLPMEFFVNIKFKDAEIAAAQMDKMKEKSEEIEIDGATYYKPSDDDAPAGLLMKVVNSTEMEVGTETYLTRSDRKVFTDGLNAAWSKIPDDAIRLAFDMAGAKSLMDDVMAMGRETVPPNFGAFVDLLGNAKDMRLSLDPDGANLLTLSATGVDEDSAVHLQEGLDSILGIGKGFAQGQVGALRSVDKGAFEVASEILKSLTPTVSGDQVEIKIPKPEGFNEAVQRMTSGNN